MPDATYQPKVYREQGGDRQVVKSGGALDVESGGEIDIESGGSLKLAGTALAATAAELNRVADTSARIVNVTAATLAVTEAAHDGKVVTLNRAAGITVTLPAATGSGLRVLFIVGTTFTSTGVIQVTGDDTMTGQAIVAQDAADTVVAFEAGATADTITLNGTTTGGLKGDQVEVIDIAADLWSVSVIAAATGTEATPFSAAV